MNITDIITKASNLKRALLEIQEKRSLWKEEKKLLLQHLLRQAKAATDFDIQIQTNDFATNSEGIIMLFNASASGIYEHTERSSKSYTKFGGSLAFSQLYNGDITAYVSYPYIEAVVAKSDMKVLGTFHPKDISEQTIYTFIAVFFDEMYNWELGIHADSNELSNRV